VTSTNISLRFVVAFVVLAIPTLANPASAAPPYDAVNDFSATSNPNGPWSFGSQASAGSTLTVFTLEDSVSVPGVDFWAGTECTGGSGPGAVPGFPVVGLNHTGATLTYAAGVSQPANMLMMHPSCSGNLSVVR
jgi:hypothetical protein